MQPGNQHYTTQRHNTGTVELQPLYGCPADRRDTCDQLEGFVPLEILVPNIASGIE